MDSLTSLISMSTGPMFLISGVGILLLVINARLIHVTDRARLLIDSRTRKKDNLLEAQILIFFKRSRMLQVSIISLSLSILSSSLILMCTILSVLSGTDAHSILMGLLLISGAGIVVSISCVISDSLHAMQALALERERVCPDKG